MKPYLATAAPDKLRADDILARTLAQNALQDAAGVQRELVGVVARWQDATA